MTKKITDKEYRFCIHYVDMLCDTAENFDNILERIEEDNTLAAHQKIHCAFILATKIATMEERKKWYDKISKIIEQ